MQTITRFDPPRNRETYNYDAVFSPMLYGREPKFSAINAAEYYIWRATKLHGRGSLVDRAEYEALKSKARFYLGLAAQYRGPLF